MRRVCFVTGGHGVSILKSSFQNDSVPRRSTRLLRYGNRGGFKETATISKFWRGWPRGAFSLFIYRIGATDVTIFRAINLYKCRWNERFDDDCKVCGAVAQTCRTAGSRCRKIWDTGDLIDCRLELGSGLAHSTNIIRTLFEYFALWSCTWIFRTFCVVQTQWNRLLRPVYFFNDFISLITWSVHERTPSYSLFGDSWSSVSYSLQLLYSISISIEKHRTQLPFASYYVYGLVEMILSTEQTAENLVNFLSRKEIYFVRLSPFCGRTLHSCAFRICTRFRWPKRSISLHESIIRKWSE